ncbi:MAG: hypothetical protein ACWA5P_07570 [bacterium]
MKNLLKYPLTYLIVLLIGYSVYDYFDHIKRNGSTFEAHPWYWLFFNIAAISSFIFIVFMAKKLIEKYLNKKNLVIEVIAIGIWLALYLLVIGPLIDAILWPFGDLSFGFKFGPFFILLIGYFILRLIINLIVGKKALYSK